MSRDALEHVTAFAIMAGSKLLACALIAGACAAPMPFKNCGTKDDIVSVTSVDVGGTVAPGDTITIG